jgi:formylglycine-generating enzyme required for sulfatase activity
MSLDPAKVAFRKFFNGLASSTAFLIASAPVCFASSGDASALLFLPDGSEMEMVWVPVTESGNKKEVKIGDFADPQGKEPVRKEIIWGPFKNAGQGYGYFLGKTEVTERQWKAVMGDSNDTDMPVTGRSFDEIQELLKRLNAAVKDGSVKGMPQKPDGTGGLFKLPSEAEWEYAARGGACPQYESKHPYGSDREIERYEVVSSAGSGGELRPVASLPANSVGLHDMLGNVREFVADASIGAGRILKGGGVFSEPREIKSSARTEQPSSAGRPDAGFRLCISAEENTKLGQAAIATDYLPIDEDPKLAEDLKTAVALAGSAVEAQYAIEKCRKKISIFERDRPSLSSDVQKTYDENIAKQKRSMADNEASFEKSASALKALPRQVQEEAVKIVRGQLGGSEKSSTLDVLEQEVLSSGN